ncbi:haloacid dehalogenase type II [Anaerocolumna sedimenticola]|uniref:Haloacid dehalogenase type II n=1 Tax=Anaerocolumna sedimenticola TaxID=2696063 RepID=A0A6P1TQ79_9FIRM|nr:haloacid dehalogenase type II [Anaerocolumna sedimenticola]
MIKAVVFDAYGTLYDVHSIVRKCEKIYPGKGYQISQVWRQKQLEYSWLRSLMDRYQDFWSLTGDALSYALDELNLQYSKGTIEDILNEYLYLDLYPEVVESLQAFRPWKLSILSNGSPKMLKELAANTNLDKHMDAIISVDSLKTYKPKANVYNLAVENLGVNKNEILFVSSNGWDVAGSKSFGFTVGWINRLNKPVERLGIEPNYIVSNLAELANKVKNK